MDGFALVAVGGLLFLFLVFLAIGKWYPGSGAEQLDWKPTRSVETEVELELDDIDQMLEAQNERRRRRGLPDRTEDEVRLELEDVDQMLEAQNERRRASGRPEISEDSIRAEVDAEERAQAERAAEFRREHGGEDA